MARNSKNRISILSWMDQNGYRLETYQEKPDGTIIAQGKTVLKDFDAYCIFTFDGVNTLLTLTERLKGPPSEALKDIIGED